MVQAADMPRRLPRGCVEDRDRHGTIRVYYRAKGQPKLRLRGTPWTPEFMAAYEEAKGAVVPTTAKGITPSTWRWLCIRYFAECTDYKLLDEKTQRIRRWILEATYDEPTAPGSPKLFRDFPLSRMTTEAIEVLRDRKIATPEAANHRVKAARAVFLWAVRKKGPDGRPYAPHNPARDVPYLKTGSTGYHSWTAEEVRQFEARHPIGTKARLALALLLLSGQRRSDVIRFGRQHIQDGRLIFTQFKGRNRKPKRLSLPILPALQRVIDASPCGDLIAGIRSLTRASATSFELGATRRTCPIAPPTVYARPARPSRQRPVPPRTSLWPSSVGAPSGWRSVTRRPQTSSGSPTARCI
jgi:integrase